MEDFEPSRRNVGRLCDNEDYLKILKKLESERKVFKCFRRLNLRETFSACVARQCSWVWGLGFMFAE